MEIIIEYDYIIVSIAYYIFEIISYKHISFKFYFIFHNYYANKFTTLRISWKLNGCSAQNAGIIFFKEVPPAGVGVKFKCWYAQKKKKKIKLV